MQCLSIYPASACITFVNVTLVKANHMVKARVNVGREYARVCILGGVALWGPPGKSPPQLKSVK